MKTRCAELAAYKKLKNNYKWSLSLGDTMGVSKRVCKDYGIEFVVKAPRQRYCEKCREIEKRKFPQKFFTFSIDKSTLSY